MLKASAGAARIPWPSSRPPKRLIPCTQPGCTKPAGAAAGVLVDWETRHGHAVTYSLHDLAAAAGYRLVPITRDPEQTP